MSEPNFIVCAIGVLFCAITLAIVSLQGGK